MASGNGGENDIPDVMEMTVQGEKRIGACGPRDILIVKSNELLTLPDADSRKEGVLTFKDKDKLKQMGIPEDCWNDDTKIIAAKFSRDTKYNVLPVEDSQDMTVKYVMDKTRSLLKATRKPGVQIIYFGPGRKKTGDWCFKDGYITFEDIMGLYDTYFIGKHLAIFSDCSCSGAWVQLAMDHLDKLKITCCVHSAKDHGKVIDVVSSCQSSEVPYSLLFATRAFINDKNTESLFFYDSYQVEPYQVVCSCGNSVMLCEANGLDSDCLLPPEYTWQKKRIAERLVIKYDSSNWYLFLVIDDENTIHDVWSGDADIEEFSELLQSGSGKITSQVKKQINKEYPGNRIPWNWI